MRKLLLLGALGALTGAASAGELYGYQVFSLDEAQAKARADGRPVLLYLTDSRR